MGEIFDQLILLLKLVIVLSVVLLLYLRFPGSFEKIGHLNWKFPVVQNATPEDLPAINSYFSLAEGPGVKTTEKQCLSCHSARLITQNKMSRERWEETIHWMQKTQGLWDLGKDEKIILDYLASYYSPQKGSRRQHLNTDKIQWYILNEITQ